MKKILLVLVVSCLTTVVIAQNSKWSHHEVLLQTRLLQQPNDFKTIYDVGIGTRWNYNLTPRLSLNFGGFLNYGKYVKDEISEDGTLYIDYFKNTEIHYFVIEEVNQLTIETSVKLQYELIKLGENKVSVLGGVHSQFTLNNKISGFRFDEYLILNENIINRNQDYNLFNDAFLNVGFSVVRPINKQCNWLFEFGYEYSTTAKTSGLFLRSGVDF